MDITNYQKETQKTAKVFHPRRLSLEHTTQIEAILNVSKANTFMAGPIKKNIFHKHELFIDARNIQEMMLFKGKITDMPVYKSATALELTPEDQIVLEGVVGMIDESGEVAEVISKYLRKEITLAQMKKGVSDELGDVLWYIARTAEGVGVNLNTIAEANLAKLAKRYPEGFTSEDSKDPDKAQEGKIQEEIIKAHAEENTKYKTALELASKAFKDVLLDPEEKIALKASAKDVKILQEAYDAIKAALGGNDGTTK